MSPITFATARIQKEYEELDLKRPVLKLILDEFATEALDAWAWPVCLIDIWRTPQEQAEIDRKSLAKGGLGMGRKPGSTSPHAAWQAADVRTIGIKQSIIDAMEKWLNDRWEYDPTQPTRMVADARPHGTGPHLHIQMKPGMTRRRTNA